MASTGQHGQRPTLADLPAALTNHYGQVVIRIAADSDWRKNRPSCSLNVKHFLFPFDQKRASMRRLMQF
jgi:hypothetical protein